MHTVALRTVFLLGMVLQQVFCSDQEFWKALIRGLAPTTAHSGSSQPFPVREIHTEQARRHAGTCRHGEDRGVEEKNIINIYTFLLEMYSCILYVNHTEWGRSRRFWTHRNCEGPCVICSQNPGVILICTLATLCCFHSVKGL